MAEPTNIITQGLLEQIRSFERELKAVDVGTVDEVVDGIARVTGLDKVRAQELVQFANGVMGIAFNLEEDNVGVIIMGDYIDIKEGDEVRATGRVMEVPVGDALIGRVVDPLGRPLDNWGVIESPFRRRLETPGPGIAERQPVD